MFCTNKECPDFLETGFHAEFVDSVTRCPRCGEYLVAVIQEEEGHGAQAGSCSSRSPRPSCSDPFEPVFETDDPGEIKMVEALLESHGIQAMTRVKSDADERSSSRMRPVEPIGETVIFLVPRSAADLAWDLLADFDDTD